MESVPNRCRSATPPRPVGFRDWLGGPQKREPSGLTVPAGSKVKGATAAFGERSHFRRPRTGFRPRPPTANAALHRRCSARAQMKWLDHFTTQAARGFDFRCQSTNWVHALDEMDPGPAAETSGRRPEGCSRPGKALTDLNQKIPPNDGPKPPAKTDPKGCADEDCP